MFLSSLDAQADTSVPVYRSVALSQAKGNAAFAAGKHEEAIEHFTEGIKVDPSNHVLYSNRSASLVSCLTSFRLYAHRCKYYTHAMKLSHQKSMCRLPDCFKMPQASLKRYDEALENAKKVRFQHL